MGAITAYVLQWRGENAGERSLAGWMPLRSGERVGSSVGMGWGWPLLGAGHREGGVASLELVGRWGRGGVRGGVCGIPPHIAFIFSAKQETRSIAESSDWGLLSVGDLRSRRKYE